MNHDIRLVAFDLDGTLTQHKTVLQPENRAVLDSLAARYKLVIVGAGSCERIHRQTGHYPIDIIGNYGMQVSAYQHAQGALTITQNHKVPVDRAAVIRTATALRAATGYERFDGDTVEIHESGMITFALLGTAAPADKKLSFDPTRTKRRAIYPLVKEAFSDYTVFVGGSSSFDIVPLPYTKSYALQAYMSRLGLDAKQAVYVGDDYGPGGNDEDVYHSPIPFIEADDYRLLGQYVATLL